MPICELGVCDGSGWIEVDELTARPCDCRALKAKRKQSKRLGPGTRTRFRGVGCARHPIADMDPALVREIRGYVRDLGANLDNGKGLWLFGDAGTGKTSLAMLVSQAALESGRSVAIYSLPRLLSDIKETYEDRSERSYMQLFERLVGGDPLHNADPRAEKRTDWVLEQLYSIINERWQEQRSIIVTTNLVDVDELREQIGPRTVSRLHEMCDLIPIMGRDKRMQQHAA